VIADHPLDRALHLMRELAPQVLGWSGPAIALVPRRAI